MRSTTATFLRILAAQIAAFCPAGPLPITTRSYELLPLTVMRSQLHLSLRGFQLGSDLSEECSFGEMKLPSFSVERKTFIRFQNIGHPERGGTCFTVVILSGARPPRGVEGPLYLRRSPGTCHHEVALATEGPALLPRARGAECCWIYSHHTGDQVMRHIASIKLVLCLLLFAPSLAMAQDQRVFVRTSFPTVTFPTQPNQEVVLASQPVALAMRKLWSFDIFAEGVFNQYPITDHWQGYVDAWICDEINCTGNIKANLAHSVMYISTDFVYRFLHLTGTFAQTNRGQQTIAILTGQLAYSLSDSSGDVASFPRLLLTPASPKHSQSIYTQATGTWC